MSLALQVNAVASLMLQLLSLPHNSLFDSTLATVARTTGPTTNDDPGGGAPRYALQSCLDAAVFVLPLVRAVTPHHLHALWCSVSPNGWKNKGQ